MVTDILLQNQISVQKFHGGPSIIDYDQTTGEKNPWEDEEEPTLVDRDLPPRGCHSSSPAPGVGDEGKASNHAERSRLSQSRREAASAAKAAAA
jgi:hypothetical protein